MDGWVEEEEEEEGGGGGWVGERGSPTVVEEA